MGLATADVVRVAVLGGTVAVASALGCEVLLGVALAPTGEVDVGSKVGDSALGVALGVVLGVTVADGQSVGRASLGSSVGVEVDGGVADGVGCDEGPANGHHQCHQLGRGHGVPVAVPVGACVGIAVSLCVGTEVWLTVGTGMPV